MGLSLQNFWAVNKHSTPVRAEGEFQQKKK